MIKFYKKRGKAIWKKQVYITEEERIKCQKVVDAFAELYEMDNIVVLDVGRYGLVELKYYKLPHGFENAITFTDSVELFESLWEEWMNTKLYLLAKGTPLLEKDYKGVFESLTQKNSRNLSYKKLILQNLQRYVYNIISMRK